MVRRVSAVLSAAVLFLASCDSGRTTSITPGAAKRHLERGVTTQAQVVETFGTPNIITRRDEGEMWVYDKVSSRSSAGAFGLGGLGGAVGSGGGGGGLIGGGLVSSRRSETTVMLIVYFDRNDLVRDYSITQTKF